MEFVIIELLYTITKERRRPHLLYFIFSQFMKPLKKESLVATDPQTSISMATPSVPRNRDVLQVAKQQLLLYLEKNIITDSSNIPLTAKLTIVSALAQDNLKTREIAGKKIPYLDHFFAKKAVNFMFNFDVSCEIVRSEFITYKEPVTEWHDKSRRKEILKDGKGDTVFRDVFEAVRDVKFRFHHPIRDVYCERMVTGTGKSYLNPATSRFDVQKMALSNAWTLFLQSFGISPKDLTDENTYNQEPEQVPYNSEPQVKKSFSPPY